MPNCFYDWVFWGGQWHRVNVYITQGVRGRGRGRARGRGRVGRRLSRRS